MTTASRRTWMITGANRGLGLAFTQAALRSGDRVAATVRSTSSLDDLEGQHGDQLLVVELDVRHRENVDAAVDRAIEHFGGLDTLVNNAGYGLVGTVEEISEAEAREIVDTDFLGPVTAYDELRTSLFGTPVVPWDTSDADGSEDPATAGADPNAAAAALLVHLDADDGPLRLMIGDDVPEHLALALAARRADYERDSRFTWP